MINSTQISTEIFFFKNNTPKIYLKLKADLMLPLDIIKI